MSAVRLGPGLVALAALAGCIPVRYADCGAGTVRLADDPANCGGCHAACPAGAPCVDGACAIPEGATVCGQRQGPPTEDGTSSALVLVAVDLQTDPAHCGACEAACPEHSSCVDGTCVCEGERLRCLQRRDDEGWRYGSVPDPAVEPWRWDEAGEGAAFERVCVDPASDPAHCGGCNVVCPEDAACIDGACVCRGDGFTFCARETVPQVGTEPPDAAGACVELLRWQAACGACGTECASSERCVEGVCVPCCEEPAPPPSW